MHFRILEMIAIIGPLTALECTKYVSGRCSVLDAGVGAYTRLTDRRTDGRTDTFLATIPPCV